MNLERLHTLYDHLMWGILGHKKFDFSKLTNSKTNKCGTAGCAVGEFPLIWEEFSFNQKGSITFNDDADGLYEYVEKWLEIETNELYHLFEPNEQFPGKYGGEKLNLNATRYQVASNIEAFIKKCYEAEE